MDCQLPEPGSKTSEVRVHLMRRRHAAVPLPSGAVLVTGGIQTGPSNGIPNQARAAIGEGEVYRP